MTWFKKSSKKTVGFTMINGDILSIALYQVQSENVPHLIAKEEFNVQTTPVAERKQLMHSFLFRAGRRIFFQHILMRERAFTKHFQFPSRNFEEIKQMLILRLPREIPSAMDQIVYHFHPVREGSQDNFQTGVLLFGVSKDLINQERELLKSFGMMPQRVVLSTIVLSSYVQKKLGPTTGLPKIVLYGVGGKGEVVLVDEQGVQYSRSFSYESAELAHSVQDALRPILESLEKKNEEIGTYDICLGGELEKLKDELFTGRYSDRLGLQPAGVHLSAVEFLLFAGASSYSEDERFNLLPDEVKERIAVAKSETHFAELRFAAVVLLTSFVLLSLFLSARMGIALSAVSRTLSVLEPSVREIKEISRAAQMFHQIKTQKVRPIDILASVHEKAPAGISLNEFEYDAKEELIRLKGLGDSQSLVDQYVRALSSIEWFSRVDLLYSESTSEGNRSQFQFAVSAVLKNGFEKK